jgi:hypothetical protein
MRKIYILFFLLCWQSLFAQAQEINAAYVAALEARYPPAKSDFCSHCYLWVNPYFKAMVDVNLRESLVTYGKFDKTKDSLVTVIKVPRTGIYASWHPAYGFQNENKFYTAINKGITDPLAKHDKGHYNAWILSAWTVDGALLSNTYDFNEGIENQGQNEGTELEVEYLTRALVGNQSAARRIHYSGPTYERVDYWKGSWGSKKSLIRSASIKTFRRFIGTCCNTAISWWPIGSQTIFPLQQMQIAIKLTLTIMIPKSQA